MLHHGSMSARYGKYVDLEYVVKKPEPPKGRVVKDPDFPLVGFTLLVVAFTIMIILTITRYQLQQPTFANTYHQTCEQPAIQTGIAEKKHQDSSYLR